ncbi:hypothetical protein [Streptomyces narbonensis]|uniref:hypothetical protein n=1 Tax=Streptomyces narbonensis TaxID=67333 RepID=UPI0019A7BAB6|nr:hypothetical protein [Streptomyces narbonensis]GGV92423.1 hypothetical protein GCM10010230_00630 [Streptomyces narbonensis]
MRAAVAGIGAAVAVAVLLTGCSGGDAGDGAQEAKGLTAAEVCRGFAKDAPTAAALKAAMGSERFRDDLSEPDRALDLLKDATKAPPADSYRPQPVKYCRLLPAESEKDSLSIEFGPAQKAPGLNSEHAKVVTSYASGLQAYSSSGIGRLYFSCGLKAPAHDIVVEAAVHGPGGVPDTDLEQRTRLITLANAAARQVSAELGCEKDGLAAGVPSPTAHPTS